MADPQPQTTDQGFLPGLLGNVGGWFGSYDPQAAYGGLLSDPATKRAFQVRELGAAAQAMAQASMPVPYKGGMPWGSFLGSAGGAAATAGDSLIQARLQQAQSEQAVQNAAALHAKQLATTEILKNYQDPNSIYNRGGGTGTGTGTDGKPPTGPAAIIAGKGKLVSSTTADDTLPAPARALLDTISGPESGGAYNVRYDGNKDATFGSFDAHPGVKATIPEGQPYAGSTSDAAGRYQFLGSTWRPLAQKYGFSDFSPVTQDQGAWHLAADTYKEKTGRDLQTDLQNGDTSRVASALHGQWPTLSMGSYGANLAKYAQPPQTASGAAPGATPPAADLGPQTASGGAYSVPPPPGPPPKPGEYTTPVRAGNVPPPPAAAAPPGGLLKLPDPTSAAPPQLLTPPAAGAPGPAAAAASPTLGLLASQQGGGEVGSPLGAATPQIAGIPRGLLAQVAGPGAAEPSAPPAAVIQQAGPPHTGAAGAAELAGLLAQQPASTGPATATPYTNAPPITGQGAPAPGPAPGPAPPAPSPALGGAAPPMPQPVMPSAIPGAPSAQDVRDANRAVILHGIAGIPLPPNISEIAKFPMVGPTAQATAAGTAAGNYPTQAALQQQKAAYDLWVAQNKPQEIRKGGMVKDPITGVITQNPDLLYSADPKTGAVHQWYSYPSTDPNVPPRVVYAGQKELGPGEKAKLEAGGKATETPVELSKDVMFPPGSAAANQWHDAQMRGENLPSNVQIQPNGSVQITATQPTGDQIAKNQEEFGKLRDAAFDARNGAFEMQELRKTLNGMGAQGPATPFYSSLSSWAISLGLTSNADVKKYLGFSPANEAAAEKMSQDLLGAVLKAQFPQRITNADITTWKDTVPRGTMLRDAYDMLMDRVLMPKFENTAGRYAAVAGLPNSGDPQLRTFNQTLETYDKAHPLTSYIHTYSYGAPDENGVPHRMRWVPSGPGRNQGDWVDDAKNPVKF